MNQVKIGKFIAECRKSKKLTQSELSNKLGVSDRAVSKWERGINMPDASIMLELSKILGITVNELLTGEVINDKDYMVKAEEKLLELQEKNTEYTKRLLFLECIIGFSCSIIFMTLIFVASYIDMNDIIRVLLVALGIILFIIGMSVCLKIEQVAGYYECNKCHHKYVPKYWNVFFAMHINRTRYMKCPKCGKRSWSKKVVD